MTEGTKQVSIANVVNRLHAVRQSDNITTDKKAAISTAIFVLEAAAELVRADIKADSQLDEAIARLEEAFAK